MNMQAIIITNLIGCAMLIVLLISSSLIRRRRTISDKIFTKMIIITGLSCIIETLTFLCDGKSFNESRILLLLGNSFLYAANMFVTFMWCIYTDLRHYKNIGRIKKYYKIIGIPAAVVVLLLIPNAKWQFMFSLDENNVYKREPLGYAVYVLTVIYLLFTVYLRYRYKKRYGKIRFFPIWMFIIPLAIGTMVQACVYGVSLAWTSVALGLVGIHMGLQNEHSYIDPLTRLYNRNYLDYMLAVISGKSTCTAGLMIDLDYFKSINDKYGHSVGDEALIDAALVIQSSVPAKADAIRFAGDEFIVIMQNSSEAEINETVENIRNSVNLFNENMEKVYKLSFSIGNSTFASGSSVDEFFSRMDENMYAEKREKHSRNCI